jgi:hypothetical protein
LLPVAPAVDPVLVLELVPAIFSAVPRRPVSSCDDADGDAPARGVAVETGFRPVTVVALCPGLVV